MQSAAVALRTTRTLRRAESAERRRYRRVAWSVRVRGLTSDGEEFTAHTIDVCAGGLRINLGRPLRQGDPLVLYIDEIGRVEGVVSRVLPEFGYAIEFRVAPRKRDKIGDQLTWIINRDRLGLTDEREAERRLGHGEVVATYGAGVVIACTVLDVSIFGVALKTSGPRPLIGERVTMGERTGTCIRYVEGGFAVDFRTIGSD